MDPYVCKRDFRFLSRAVLVILVSLSRAAGVGGNYLLYTQPVDIVATALCLYMLTRGSAYS